MENESVFGLFNVPLTRRIVPKGLDFEARYNQDRMFGLNNWKNDTINCPIITSLEIIDKIFRYRSSLPILLKQTLQNLYKKKKKRGFNAFAILLKLNLAPKILDTSRDKVTKSRVFSIKSKVKTILGS